MDKRAVQIGITAGLAIALLAGMLLFGFNKAKAPQDHPVFAPYSMDAVPLRIVVQSMTDTTTPTKTVLRYDGSGTSDLTSTKNEETVRLVQTDEAAYTCEANACTLLEGTTSHPLFSPGDFIYADSDIHVLRQSLTFISEGACSVSGGICSVWKSLAQNDGQEIEVEVEKASNRIVLLRGNSPVGGATLLYEYPDTLTIDTP